MVRVRMNDMERNSGISLYSDRQVEFTIIPQFEKAEAPIALEKLVGKEPNIHFVISRSLQGKNAPGFQVRRPLF